MLKCSRSQCKEPNKRKQRNGSFIQFDNLSFEMNKDGWQKLIRDMYENGLRRLVIQYVSYDMWKDGKFLANADFMDGKRDLVEEVLSIADTYKDLDVQIGLYLTDEWWSTEKKIYWAGRHIADAKASVETNTLQLEQEKKGRARPERIAEIERYVANDKKRLALAIEEFEPARVEFAVTPTNGGGATWIEKSLHLIPRIRDKYNSHKSFTGYYIPLEIPSRKYSEETTDALSASFKQIADSASSANNAKVSFSPFRAGEFAGSGDENLDFFSKFLSKSGIKIMMPQDSVGHLNPKDKDPILKLCVPYLNACKGACEQNSATILPILECWKDVGTPTQPDIRACSIERVLMQLEIETALFPNAGFTAFDLNHHLSPTGKAEAQTLRKEFDRLHAE